MKIIIAINIIFLCSGLFGQGTSLINNPNFTMVWNEEFNGNTLNTSRWTVQNDLVTINSSREKVYNSNSATNVKVQNGWLILNSTFNNHLIQQGNIICDFPSFDNAIYEVKAKFKSGLNANPSAWFWNGEGDCPASNFAQYQEIDILEYLGGNIQKTTGGVHVCWCTCANTDLACRTGAYPTSPDPGVSDCRNSLTAERRYALNSVENDHIYYARWTYRAGIWTGQDYNPLSYRYTPTSMLVNQTGKIFELASGRPGCTKMLACGNDLTFPYWYHVDHVRVFQMIHDCQNDVVEIPNFSTFVYGVKNTITLSNLTTIPTTPIHLYAQTEIELKNGFQVPAGADVSFGIIECR